MPEKIREVEPPRGLARLAWRAPIWLYRLGLGGLLGGRFVLLNHVGRKSRQLRQAVVEVVSHNKETGTYIVASGFGEKADWYKNVTVYPDITIQVGWRRTAVHVERLPLPQATEVMLDYNRRHPAALGTLAGIMGYRLDGSEADVLFFGGRNSHCGAGAAKQDLAGEGRIGHHEPARGSQGCRRRGWSGRKPARWPTGTGRQYRTSPKYGHRAAGAVWGEVNPAASG